MHRLGRFLLSNDEPFSKTPVSSIPLLLIEPVHSIPDGTDTHDRYEGSQQNGRHNRCWDILYLTSAKIQIQTDLYLGGEEDK